MEAEPDFYRRSPTVRYVTVGSGPYDVAQRTGTLPDAHPFARNLRPHDAAMNGKLEISHYINRELSWLEFNGRVLEEAQDGSNPLLERVKFLSIFSSNLDEFFMVRVAGLREQAFGDSAPQDFTADGLRAVTQLERIATRTQQLVAAQYDCWNHHVRPQLHEAGIHLLNFDELNDQQRDRLETFFQERAFPILTPMAVDPSHPRPRYHNRGLYLAAMLHRDHGLGPSQLLAVVQLPQVLPRLVPIGDGPPHEFILLEHAVAAWMPRLFGGFQTESWTTFRITRDSDTELLERESDDMLRLIEQRIKARQRAQAVRLEIGADSPEELIRSIAETEELIHDPDPERFTEIYFLNGPLDLTSMRQIVELPGLDEYRDPSFTPAVPRGLRYGDTAALFDAIRDRDFLLHHPFESFKSVVDFVQGAAHDPDVVAIKQTLYRTSGDSPIVRALMEAAENGKHVTALVELKARFDEAANVTWARQLERAGVHVVFGFLDLKTHCKVSLVVRQEGSHLRRYVHLATGNYNPTTARLYTDVGLFTTDEDLADDASALFNLLTGYSQGYAWRKFAVAPEGLHQATINLIRAQTERAAAGQPSRIFAKMNALVDHRVIEALFDASRAGVPIDLVVRGICCLRPGLPEVSENIRVRSIVDRFLEHSRVYVFGPDEEAQIYLSSADWMPRNFFRRVEIMFPVEAEELRRRILTEIVPAYLGDNQKARVLGADGHYTRVHPAEGQEPRRCQVDLLAMESGLAGSEEVEPQLEAGTGLANPATSDVI